MKVFALTLLLSVSLSAQTAKTTKKTQAAPAATTAPAEVVIPKGAVEQSDGNFHYTDAKGKKWLYRKTPFGISKVEDKAVPVAPTEEDKLTVATDAGDSVHFEKPSPFGPVKWDKKKTELDSNEQSIWNRQKKQ